MTILREERAACTIEAGATDLHDGHHWKPWLRLIRRSGGSGASRTFDALKPVFGSQQAAVRYAAELGRSLADEGWNPDRGTQPTIDTGLTAHLRSFSARAGMVAGHSHGKALRSGIFLSLALLR